MSRSLHKYIEFLYEALSCEGVGLIISSTNIEVTRQRLYQARKHDPEFNRIAIMSHRLEPQTKLILARKGEEDEGTPPEENP